MIIILHMPDIPADSPSGRLIKEWIEEIKNDKRPANVSPLRFVHKMEFKEDAE